ncbi:MAG: hypothetical protein NTV59_04390 [Chloroflexi bacterium]|nr:hypothetical protein [Chloroflexota bacterium]
MLIIWWLVPGLVWASRPIILSADEYTLQATIGTLMLGWTPFLFPLLVIATVFFLWKGFRHRKLTGVSPKGFRAFVYTSIVGFCGCAAGIGLFVHSL